VAQANLRILPSRFVKELLREEAQVVGRLDGRYLGVDPDSAGEAAESDPTVDAIASAFTAALNIHLTDLGVRMDRPYVSLRTIEEWNWLLEARTPNGGGYVNVVPFLGRAMRRNKDMRVLLASGYYDLATPFFGAENALSQDGLVHDRILYTYYEAGHLLHLHEPSRVALLNDVRRFIQAGAPAPAATAG
jgi:carboxypeptidase C (cathepsin A)